MSTADNYEVLEYFCGEALHVFQDKHSRRNCGVANGKKVFFPTWIESVCCLIFMYQMERESVEQVYHFLSERPDQFSPLWILHL